MNDDNTKSIEELEEEERLRKAAVEKNKQEELKKLASLPKPKFSFDVKIDSMIPATLTFRVIAETPEQAAELIKNMQPTGVKHKLAGRKDSKITVLGAGSNIIKWFKKLY